jgi:cell division protein FtsB
MKKFENKRQLKSRLYSRTAVTMLLLCVLLLCKGVFGLYVKSKESATARDAAQARLTELTNRKEVIAREIQNLSQSQGVDREVREKFNVVKPGEKVVLIMDDELPVEVPPKKGFFSSIWHGVWD